MKVRAKAAIVIPNPLDFFFERVACCPVTGCWFWLGAMGTRGYGNLSLLGKYLNAHVASFLIFNGPIPADQVVRHTCHQRLCCNPDHLILGSQRQNMIDMIQAGRGWLPGFGVDRVGAWQ